MSRTGSLRTGLKQTGSLAAAAVLLALFAGCPRPPNQPDPPRGPARWTRGVVLACTTSTSDPSGSDISYQFDWGDNSQSAWSGLVPGGTAFADTHTYDDAGVVQVRSRARNENGKVSDWSDPLSIQIDPGEGEVRWAFGYYPDPLDPTDSADLSAGTFARGPDGTFYLSGGDEGGALLARHSLGTRYWEFMDVDEDEFATPTVGPDSTIYCGTAGNMLYAITSHGQKKWEARFGAPIVAPVALGADRTIYLQCEDDTMYAVSPEDGSIRWFFHRSGGTAPPVVGIDGTVFVCQDDTLFALEPGAGMVKWRFAMPQVIATPPAIDTGRGSIYVCDEDGNFVSVDLTDGTENWRQVPGSDPSAAVVGPDHTIYVCGGGRLFAFSDNGGSNWIFTPPMAGLASTPAISADGRVYILIVADKKDRRLGSDTLYAVNTVDGTRRWGCGLGSGSSDVPSAPKIDAEGYVYVADGMCGWCVVGSGGPAASPWPMYQHDFQNTGRAQ